MAAPQFLVEQMDNIASVACVSGSLVCVYLMQVILRERSPLVDLQRASLGFLAITMLANGVYYYPDWALIEGHRPTGVLMDVAMFINLLIMAIRGRMVNQDHPSHS